MQFTVRRGHEEFGPYTLDQLRQFVNEGRILPNDHVYDGQNWIYVNQVISTQQPVLNMPSGAPPQINQSPNLQSQQPHGPNLGLIVGPMLSSQKWVRLISVLGFIGGACNLIIALTSLMAGSAGFVIALLYIVFASLVLYPAYLLWSYANTINHLRGGFQINTLKNAIEIQAKWWTFTGIMTLVGIIISVLMVILIIAGVGFLGIEIPKNILRN